MADTGFIGVWGNNSASTGVGNYNYTGAAFSTNSTDIVQSLYDDLDEGINDLPEDNMFSDNFLGWLNRGENNNVVYFGIKNGKAVYTGITKQVVSARLAQHNQKGKGFSSLEVQHSELTRNQARSVEQYYIDHGPNELNKINSISPLHKFRSSADQWALKYLGLIK